MSAPERQECERPDAEAETDQPSPARDIEVGGGDGSRLGDRSDNVSEISDGPRTVVQRLRGQPRWKIVLEVLGLLAGIVGTGVVIYEVFFKEGGGDGSAPTISTAPPGDCRSRTMERRSSCGGARTLTLGGATCDDSYSGGCVVGERETGSATRDCRVDGAVTICYYDVVCCGTAAQSTLGDWPTSRPAPHPTPGGSNMAAQSAAPGNLPASRQTPHPTPRPTTRPTPRPTSRPTLGPGGTHWAPRGTDWSCVSQAGSSTCASVVACVEDCADRNIVEYSSTEVKTVGDCIETCYGQYRSKYQCFTSSVGFSFSEGFFTCAPSP